MFVGETPNLVLDLMGINKRHLCLLTATDLSAESHKMYRFPKNIEPFRELCIDFTIRDIIFKRSKVPKREYAYVLFRYIDHL